MIYKESGIVKSNIEIAEGIYQTDIFSPNISQNSFPGQFINILPSSNWSYVMRRPMSIANQINNEISIIYKAIGEGTRIMSNWLKNDKIDLLGPLGNKWEGYESNFPILIGGGVGIAPILNLHKKLNNIGIKHILIMGARNSKEHFLEHNPDANIYMSTDDGSLGINGNVVNVLKFIFLENKLPLEKKFFTCGPPMMMEAVRSYALQNDIKCDLALETLMACGVGICQGCTVERKLNNADKHSYRNQYALACIDGPIFKAKEIITCS